MKSVRLTERIVGVRKIEEEQSRRSLELALAELAQLELALDAAGQRESAGRMLIAASAASGDVADRVAGIEESRSAARHTAALAARIRTAKDTVASLRQDYLGNRTARMQAETLAGHERARKESENLRRAQQTLDEWHLNRLRPAGNANADGGRS
jgi:hypothetical protein